MSRLHEIPAREITATHRELTMLATISHHIHREIQRFQQLDLLPICLKLHGDRQEEQEGQTKGLTAASLWLKAKK